MHATKPGLALISLLVLSNMGLAAPNISLSKKIGPPTSQILVSGTGFAANVGVDIFFDTTDEALVETDGNGGFHNATVHAPHSAHPGEHWVSALERNDDEGAQEPFIVNTDWTQFNFSADHEGLNPFENILNPENVSKLNPSWTYYASFNWVAGPAVAEGIVYAGSYGGNAYAINATTGALLWETDFDDGGITYPTVADGLVYISAGSYINALDPETGVRIWRSTDDKNSCCFSPPTVVNGRAYTVLDNVVALDSRTGALVWKYPMDGSNQAVANGVVYVVRSQPKDNVLALDAKTGTLLWMSVVDGTPSFAPTVSNGLLYIPISSGDMCALDASTGALRWRFTTDVVGPPSSAAVAGGLVFFSSYDNTAYAVNAETGTMVWSYAAGGGLFSAAAAVANGVVYFGLGNNLFAFEPKTGAVLWQYMTLGDITFPATVTNGVLYFISSGTFYRFDLGVVASESSSMPRDRPHFRALHPDFTLRPRLR